MDIRRPPPSSSVGRGRISSVAMEAQSLTQCFRVLVHRCTIVVLQPVDILARMPLIMPDLGPLGMRYFSVRLCDFLFSMNRPLFMTKFYRFCAGEFAGANALMDPRLLVDLVAGNDRGLRRAGVPGSDILSEDHSGDGTKSNEEERDA